MVLIPLLLPTIGAAEGDGLAPFAETRRETDWGAGSSTRTSRTYVT